MCLLPSCGGNVDELGDVNARVDDEEVCAAPISFDTMLVDIGGMPNFLFFAGVGGFEDGTAERLGVIPIVIVFARSTKFPDVLTDSRTPVTYSRVLGLG